MPPRGHVRYRRHSASEAAEVQGEAAHADVRADRQRSPVSTEAARFLQLCA